MSHMPTNSLQILKDVDHIIVMKDGTIGEKGTYQELMNKKGAFADYLTQYLETNLKDDVEPALTETHLDAVEPSSNTVAIPPRLQRTLSTCSDTIYGSTPNSMKILSRSMSAAAEDPEMDIVDHSLRRRLSRRLSMCSSHQETPDDDAGGLLIEEEAALTGRVKWSVYYDYVKCLGLWGAFLVVFFYVVGQALHSASNVWYIRPAPLKCCPALRASLCAKTPSSYFRT